MKIIGRTLNAIFLSRINRFTAEVEIKGRAFPAHLPNPSKLFELLRPGARLLLKTEEGRRRKTTYTIVGVYDGDLLVGIDSRFPNMLFSEAVEEGLLAEFSGYHIAKREFRFDEVRFDFLLERPGDRALVETKSCSLVLDGVALFPDVPTERGLRHVLKLIDAVKYGFRAYIVWVVQRPDAKYLRPYKEVHPEIEEALARALVSGVNLLAYRAQLIGSMMHILGSIPVRVEEATSPRLEGVATFINQKLGLEYGLAKLYCSLVTRGVLSKNQLQATQLGEFERMTEIGLAILHPSKEDALIPVHPRLAVTNIVNMVGKNTSRADVDRAVALLIGLYKIRERADG